MSGNWITADWPVPCGIVAGTILRNSDFQLPAEPQWLNQVHSNRVVHWDSCAFDDGPPDADAIISDQPDSICVVRTADCLPVLLCAKGGAEIAAIHAGWRGLAGGVIETTVDAMNTPAGDLVAWFGPAISQPVFEVGDEVRDVFCEAAPDAGRAFVQNARGRWQADLYSLARQRLAGAGISDIHGGGWCTFAEPGRFYSYRRDGATGRLLNFVYRP